MIVVATTISKNSKVGISVDTGHLGGFEFPVILRILDYA